MTMKDILAGTADAILRPKRRNLMQDENIVFHHVTQAGEGLQDADRDEDLDKLRELESYRRRFEEAMIQIEDQEDIEAYKEAKAEIDDEFDDDDQAAKPPAAETDQPADKPSTNEKTEVIKDKPD